MDLSIVIPVYNEQDNLRELHREIVAALTPQNRSFEIVCVDDGSRDDSVAVLRALQAEDSRVRIIQFDRNHGQTAAIDAGFRFSRGDVVITMDADRQNDPADIPLLLNELRTHDVCIGWRHKRQDNAIRRVSSRFANWVRNTISKETVADTGCSLKAFKAEVVRKFKLFEGLHRFLPTLAKMEGYTVAEVKVNHRPRVKGASKYGVFNRAWKSFKDLIAIRWMQQRMLRYRAAELQPGTAAESTSDRKTREHVG